MPTVRIEAISQEPMGVTVLDSFNVSEFSIKSGNEINVNIMENDLITVMPEQSKKFGNDTNDFVLFRVYDQNGEHIMQNINNYKIINDINLTILYNYNKFISTRFPLILPFRLR